MNKQEEKLYGITKEQFLKMLANADVDDTNEFWEAIYDKIEIESRQSLIAEIREKVKKINADGGGNGRRIKEEMLALLDNQMEK